MKSTIVLLSLILLLTRAEAAPAKKVEAKASYDGLVKLLELNPNTKKPVQTLEELIPLLPRELRENFTFVYQSRSPHGGLGDDA